MISYFKELTKEFKMMIEDIKTSDDNMPYLIRSVFKVWVCVVVVCCLYKIVSMVVQGDWYEIFFSLL